MSMIITRGLVAPSVTFGDDPRAARVAHEHKLLTRSLTNYVCSRHDLISLGPDPVAQQIMTSKGFARFDFTALHVAVRGWLVTVVAVPTRIWRDADARRALMEAKTEAKDARTRFILIPQRWLRGNVRGHVAMTLAMARDVQYDPTQVEELLVHVTDTRMATLKECADLVRDHPDPFGVVLAICCAGRLRIERRRSIGPTSIVSVP